MQLWGPAGGRRPRRQVRPSARFQSILGVLGSVGVLLLLTPLAAAVGPITYVAPYQHLRVAGLHHRATSGCAHVGERQLHWNGVLGSARWLAHSGASSCRSLLGSWGVGSFADSALGLTVALPISTFPGSTRATSVAVDWVITAIANASTRAGAACPPVKINPSNGSGSQFCYLGASASLAGDAYLLDRTNGSIFYASNYWSGVYASDYDYNYTDCSAFSCVNLNYTYAGTSGSGNVSLVTWWINATLNHMHRYAVVTDLYGNVSAETTGYPKSHAAAVLDLYSPGLGADLASVSIT